MLQPQRPQTSPNLWLELRLRRLVIAKPIDLDVFSERLARVLSTAYAAASTSTQALSAKQLPCLPKSTRRSSWHGHTLSARHHANEVNLAKVLHSARPWMLLRLDSKPRGNQQGQACMISAWIGLEKVPSDSILGGLPTLSHDMHRAHAYLHRSQITRTTDTPQTSRRQSPQVIMAIAGVHERNRRRKS